MFGPHFQSEKREGYSGRCYNRHSFRPCLQGVNVSREEGSLAYPYYPGRANVLSRFTWQNLANSLHEKQKVFSTRRVTWGTYHLHGKTGYSGWKIKWFAPFRFTLGTRGFYRVRREFSVLAKVDTSSAVGRSHERQVARETWQKPETALDKSLAPRVHPFGTLQKTWAVIWGDGIFGSFFFSF